MSLRVHENMPPLPLLSAALHEGLVSDRSFFVRSDSSSSLGGENHLAVQLRTTVIDLKVFTPIVRSHRRLGGIVYNGRWDCHGNLSPLSRDWASRSPKLGSGQAKARSGSG